MGASFDISNCLRENLIGVASSLKEWSQNVPGDLEKRLKKAKELKKWRPEPISDTLVSRLYGILR